MKPPLSRYIALAQWRLCRVLQVEGIRAELWVLREADAERASRVLKYEMRSDEPPWVCGACGEASGPQLTQCWRCGAYREAGGRG